MSSAFAMESSHCEMDGDMSSMFTQSMLSRMQMSIQTDNQSDQMNHEQMNSEQTNQDCCCCDDGCSSNCDMGTTASLLMQVSSYSPVFINTGNILIFSPELQLRALTPPSRPPLVIS